MFFVLVERMILLFPFKRERDTCSFLILALINFSMPRINYTYSGLPFENFCPAITIIQFMEVN
jgi:hypothetical protein